MYINNDDVVNFLAHVALLAHKFDNVEIYCNACVSLMRMRVSVSDVFMAMSGNNFSSFPSSCVRYIAVNIRIIVRFLVVWGAATFLLA